jgi:RNA polymerase sigma factor (TIGR02999 family)
VQAQPLMPPPTRPTATQLLGAWRQGDANAADALFACVYDDLRALARRQLARRRPGGTLAPTALVHEAYLKFAERSAPAVVDRHHFLAVAARAMRNIVIDHIRRRQAQKRDDGGGLVALPAEVAARAEMAPSDVLAIHEALEELQGLDPRQAQVVELRFFGGLELKEIAAVLDTTERTVKRDWQRARAFLYASLR